MSVESFLSEGAAERYLLDHCPTVVLFLRVPTSRHPDGLEFEGELTETKGSAQMNLKNRGGRMFPEGS
eukprot:s75_g25.t1